MPTALLLLAALATGAAQGPAAAHHSFQMFDLTQTQTVQGTVKEFRWANPHAVLVIAAANATWSIELTSPGNLTRAGWSRHSVNVGDQVSASISPLRDGEHGGGLRKLTLASGKILPAN